VPARLIEDADAIDERWLDGAVVVGVTSGASAPESLVTRVVEHFQALGTQLVESHELVDEDVHFSLPVELRRAAAR
jgi:4-hydroxy-3-methylbut-2-enyl diphosphate reductase